MPRKQFKSSSYDRVADVLQGFDEWKDLEPLFVKRVNSLKVSGAVHSRSTVYDHKVQEMVLCTSTHFQIHDETEMLFLVAESAVLLGKPENIDIDMGNFIPKEAIENLVNKHFGTPSCPTFNCKKDKVLEKLQERAKSAVFANCQGLIDQTRERLLQAATALMQTDEYKTAKGRTFDEGVIKEFKSLCHKYANKVGAEVLKEAWREYVAEDIMEV